MDTLKRKFSRFENRFDTTAERFIFHHPLLGLLVMFIGLPLLTLLAVVICTLIAMLPMVFPQDKYTTMRVLMPF